MLTAIHLKFFILSDELGGFINEFESLFAQLNQMGDNSKMFEFHNDRPLLWIMGSVSSSGWFVATLRIGHTEKWFYKVSIAD